MSSAVYKARSRVAILSQTSVSSTPEQIAEARRDLRAAKLAAAVEKAIITTTPKMKSQAAGKMGFGTTEVGDLVASAL